MIRFLLDAYSLIIIAYVILSYIPTVKNEGYTKFVNKLAGYTINPVRELLPNDLAFDVSPLIVLVILRLIPAIW